MHIKHNSKTNQNIKTNDVNYKIKKTVINVK